ncbi:hypothetical protein [Ralstonia pseudosolanacearum]|uniref:hypothetical protein n=1 Tax=Ralstonia pseudosolanacearum TaxID=1310165 RepID=UPI003CEDCEB9
MTCVLLAAGWYFHSYAAEQGYSYVADSLAPQSEFGPGCHLYGPAAWDGKSGPAFGRELVKVRPAHWEQWSADIEQEIYGGGPDAGPLREWPAVVEVTEAGKVKGLASLHGLTIHSEAELIARVNFFAQLAVKQAPRVDTAQGRLANVERHFPEVLGGAGSQGAKALH